MIINKSSNIAKMTKPLKVLIIDDHIAIIEAYQNAFSRLSANKDYTFKIDSSTSCDQAILKMNDALTAEPYDLFFLDISLPPSKDGRILSGEDLGKEIRRSFQKAKIIVSTHHSNNYRIYSIFNRVNPEGLLIKSEAGLTDFMTAIKTVLQGCPYYTKTVLEFFRRNIANHFNIDDKDRQLLYELSKGAKLKDLSESVNLSIGGIERRKRLLKQTFNAADKSDLMLVKTAKKHGLL